MKIRGSGFQKAVAFLEPHASAARLVAQAKQPVIKQLQVVPEVQPTENKPFDGSNYAKFAVPSPWLVERGFEPRTLERFGVFQYDNPARKERLQGQDSDSCEART
jgi:hypothetical protein